MRAEEPNFMRLTCWRRYPMTEVLAELRAEIKRWTHGAHYVNIVTRRNGRDEPDEADWLKNLPDIIAAAIAEEREACAKIAETATMGPIPILSATEALGAGHGASFMREKIAAAIRGRT